MRLATSHPVIDEVLDEWRAALGAARPAYAGHVYRVFNVARELLGSDRSDDALAVASAFHDIGIWSDRTFDYLGPSVARAREYTARRAPVVDSERVAALIDQHHRLFAVRYGHAATPAACVR